MTLDAEWVGGLESAPVKNPIITLDGPAGAGKSTVARTVARDLGFRFLDTGAMYRAFTWKALETGLDLRDEKALVASIRASRLEMEGGRVVLDGRDISADIRSERITRNSVYLADPPAVRAELVKHQQAIGRAGGLVTEGRDQGTIVFPDAEFKFYLDASVEVRARRRVDELVARGEKADYPDILTGIADRDERDRRRPVGALRKPAGAIEIDTSHLTIDDVVKRVISIVRG